MLCTDENDDSLGHDPPNRSQLRLHPSLLHMRVLLLDLVGEPERDDWEAFIVELGIGLVERLVASDHRLSSAVQSVECTGGLRNVDLREDGEIPRVGESSGDEAGFRQVVLHDSSVAAESEVQDCSLAVVLGMSD